MADDMNRQPGAEEGSASLEKPQGGFLNSIIDIFVDPFKVFARIDAGLTWWKPFVLVTVVAVIMSYLMLPFQQRLIELNPRGMSEEQVQGAVEGFGKFAPLTLIFVPIVLILTYLIAAAVVHLVVNIMSSRSNYRKTLSLVSYCGIITVIEQIIVSVVLKSRGVESIESPADFRFSLSLAPLLPDEKGLLSAVLRSLSVFQIWYYVVFILGIAAIFKISRKQAIIPALPIWIFSVLMIWIGSMFGGGMG